MVKPQAAASGKAGMICAGEHILTAARNRRPDRRWASQTLDGTTRLGGCNNEKFFAGVSLKPLAARPVRIDEAARERADLVADIGHRDDLPQIAARHWADRQNMLGRAP